MLYAPPSTTGEFPDVMARALRKQDRERPLLVNMSLGLQTRVSGPIACCVPLGMPAGEFPAVTARAVRKQDRDRPLVEVAADQAIFHLEKEDGVLVGESLKGDISWHLLCIWIWEAPVIVIWCMEVCGRPGHLPPCTKTECMLVGKSLVCRQRLKWRRLIGLGGRGRWR